MVADRVLSFQLPKYRPIAIMVTTVVILDG